MAEEEEEEEEGGIASAAANFFAGTVAFAGGGFVATPDVSAAALGPADGCANCHDEPAEPERCSRRSPHASSADIENFPRATAMHVHTGELCVFRYVTHTHRERAENRPRLARDLSVCGLCGWGNYAPFMLRLLLLLSSTALMFRSAGALCMGVQGHALHFRSSVPRLAARSRLLGTKQVCMVAKPDDTAVQPYDDGLFAVAPMMDYTDRFLRFLLRRLTTKATLYTEMVTANTIVHCQESELPRFLEHDTVDEQPVVLQIGGADPENLRKASAIAEPYGYSAINLNVGCPSDRVAGSGCFGAALMENPTLVADCCAAMADGVGHRLPITVKCRIGVTKDRRRAKEIDDEATYDELARFVDTVATRGGVRCFQIHARKAVLGGLSPAQNRQIPPLRYNLVHQLAADFPEMRFALNGGVETIDDAHRALQDGERRLSGVMVGRSVVAKPWHWSTLDTSLYGCDVNPAASRREVLSAYAEYADAMEAATPQRIRHLLIKPAVNLFAGEPHGKSFRRAVDETAADKSIPAGQVLLRAAGQALLDETLDAPPGHLWDYTARAYVSPREHASPSPAAGVADDARAAAM